MSERYLISTNGKFVIADKGALATGSQPTNKGTLSATGNFPIAREILCVTLSVDFWGVDFKIIIYPEGNITVGFDRHSTSNTSDYAKEIRDAILEATGGKLHMATFTSNMQGIKAITSERRNQPNPDKRLSDWYYEFTIETTDGRQNNIIFNKDGTLEFAAKFPYVACYPALHSDKVPRLPVLHLDDKFARFIGDESMSSDDINRAVDDALVEYGGKVSWIKTKTVFDYPNTIKRLTSFADYNEPNRVSGLACIYFSKKSALISTYVIGKEVKIIIGADKCSAQYVQDIFSWDSNIGYNIPGGSAKQYRITKAVDVKKMTDDQIKGLVVNTVNMLRAKTQFYA
jgi:hypothetical protein